MKRIILTGGGTAGHVTPNIALLPRLKMLATTFSTSVPLMEWRKKLIEAQASLTMVLPPANSGGILI